MLLLSVGGNAQVSGFVFRDFNANGVKDNTATFNETFLGGITVKAYNAAGVEVGSTTTSGTGAYSFTGLTLPLRIEFSGLTTEDYTGPAGTANASSVQFYSAATTSANLGVNYPAHYCQSAPDYVVSRYKNVAVASSPSMIKVPYSASGTNNPAIETMMANKGQIGIVWGTAYNRTLSTIYASTFVKRHSGSTKDSDSDGKEDIGMIYSVPLTGGPAAWLNLTTLGVDVGLSSMPTIAQRDLNTTDVSDLSYDDQVFSQIGKIGLGDMDISDDDKYLYVVNLFDRKLYTIDIATKTLVGSGATIPSSCSGGVMRPFAVKYHRGKVYVGTVCDASVSQSRADLTATVYAFDGTTFTSVLSAPLNYAKGAAFIDGPPGGPQYGTRWEPWTDDATLNTQFAFITSNGNRGIIYCQPMLADLEFDVNSDMILVFDDRLGHQSGTNNVGPDPTRTSLTLYTSVAGGDILRASFATGTYVLENNGTSGGVTTSGAGNNQGPGGGEFYTGDESLSYHQETVNGGAMLLAGYGEVAATIVDPINFFAEGPRWMSNSTGLALRSYEVRPSTGFFNIEDGGKANGLGDLEVLCNAAPLEIGNRIWRDTDNDGVQDAGEPDIANVSLELFADFDNNGMPDGLALGMVSTNSTGNWYFNATNVTDGDPLTTGNQAGPQPNKRYLVRVATSDWAGGVGTGDLSGLSLTMSNTGGAGQPDVRDNDASLVSSVPTIAYLTGDAGENDHTLDMGFKVACSLSDAGKSAETCNNNGTSSTSTDDYITFSLNPTGAGLGATYSVSVNNGGTVTLAGGGAATGISYGSAVAFRLQNGSANNTLYTITVTDASGTPCTVTTTVQQSGCSVPPVCNFTVSNTTPVCHANGTPENAVDDYVSFVSNIMNSATGSTQYTITATQNGNPIVITLVDGTAANAVNFGLNTPLRTPAGTAGQGLITLFITDNNLGCSTTAVLADPGTCATACVPGVPQMVTYEYTTPFNITDLNQTPINLPQFDDMGGTRMLNSVKLDYEAGITTVMFHENRATNPQIFKADLTGNAILRIGATTIASPSFLIAMPFTNFAAGVLVPAQGTWPGDVVPPPPATPTPSTLLAMNPWVNDEYLTYFRDPRTDPRWVTNATGNLTHDDDMLYITPVSDVETGTFTYSTVSDMAPFKGTGTVPLTVSTLTGIASTGGGGNIVTLQRTRAYGYAKVTYFYTCPAPAVCALASAGKTLETCNNNGTSANTTDDYITFSLNPTGSNLGATYSVTANNGGTVTLAAGGAATAVPYGSATAFRLQSGSANSTSYTITITDAGGAPCTATATVQQASCSASACTSPVLSVNNAAICAGEARDLTTLVTGNTPAGTLSFHVTLADANAGTNPLTNAVVRPLTTTTYYIRSEITGTCYSTASTQITVSNPPTLAVVNSAICTGGSINLATLVTSSGGGTLSYFSSLSDAQNNTNALTSPVVTPVSATNYFIRSTNAAGCYTIQNVVVSQIAANCGATQLTGPN